MIAKTCGGNDQSLGGDVVRVEAHRVGKNVPDTTPMTIGACDDDNNGTYACNINATSSGN